MYRYTDLSIVIMLIVMVGLLTFGSGQLAMKLFTTDNGAYHE